MDMQTERNKRVAQVAALAEDCNFPFDLDPADYGTATAHEQVVPGKLACRVDDGSSVFMAPDVALLDQNVIDVKGKENTVLIGRGARLHKSVIKVNGSNCLVFVGAGCRIGKITKLNASGDGSRLVLGPGTTIESGVLLAGEGEALFFGKDCMISNSFMARTHDGHSIWDMKSRARIGLPASVTVGHHVWLGNGSRISKGATIGQGAIVGQQALVTGNIEPHSLNVGSPTKQIRANVGWSRSTDFDDIPDFIKDAFSSQEDK
ncbi:acyltransferase [Sulfitobacter porphyrae]|uniref:Acyltransferase n=1 Tax=Sulfitobacter porphyrae TaxID=1246864 RepID=A0ABW2B5N1_9RHOB|nr:hypothetical protein GCM10007928_41040 [Sulfitobacter porphyrae]